MNSIAFDLCAVTYSRFNADILSMLLNIPSNELKLSPHVKF